VRSVVRLPLRLVVDGGATIDVAVRIERTCTVGELADRLAQHIGAPSGSTVASRWPSDRRSSPPARGRRVADVGPRAGASVVLVPAPPETTDPGRSAPARLEGDGRVLELQYGANIVGDTAIQVDTLIEVQDLGASTTRVNGAALLGSARVLDGDLLRLQDEWWTVRVDGALRPPPDAGAWRPHTPRPTCPATEERGPITLPTPPAAVRLPGFPTLSATVPLLMGVGLWVATRSLAAAVFVLFSFVFVVASGIEARREARAEDRFRVAEFRADLEDSIATVDERRAAQSERLERLVPPLATLRAMAEDPTATAGLWQRSAHLATTPPEDLLRVRLGRGPVVLSSPVQVPDGGRRELRQELSSVAAAVRRLDDAVTADLGVSRGLAIVGAGEAPAACARSIVAQLACAIGPGALSIDAATSRTRRATWDWIEWLPHRDVTPDAATDTLVVVDGLSGAQASAEATARGGRPIVVWIGSDPADVPAELTCVLAVRAGVGELHRPGGDLVEIDVLESATLDEVEPIARSLASVVATRGPQEGRPDVPIGPVRLADVVADPAMLVDATAVRDRWARRDEGLSVPLAAAGGEGTAHHVVSIDLLADGPHALVAGTTGAGKSELLRTLLVSAALHHPPDRLHFLLIDYKGGAAFGALTELSHTVGIITDLTPLLARRALVSLRAEVRRREEVLAAESRTQWTGAALVVVVDEFATLASELPEFVDGLVDVAQRGRSLGVHLVLATQRPAGVVTDAIRANTTLRIALRVADEDDSRDVVDSPVAASFPCDAPGRAVLRVGPLRSVVAQVAWSSGPLQQSEAAVVQDLARPVEGDARPHPSGADVPSELDHAVDTIRLAARGLAPPRRPWLDPLGDRVTFAELTRLRERRGIGADAVAVGIVDRPDTQDHDLLRVDLGRDGGLMVVGASGSGRSSTVASVAGALEHCGVDWHVHVVAAGGAPGGPLHTLRDLHSVGDLVATHDVERVTRLLRSTCDELADRRSEATGRHRPRRLVVIDGMGAFEELYERVDRGHAVDLLGRIARDGRAVGLHLMVTASRPAEVPSAVAAGLGARWWLRAADADAASLAGLPPGAADPEQPPGRCWIDGHMAQVADPSTMPPGRSGTGTARPAPPVPRLPASVALGRVGASAPSPPLRATIAIDADTMAPVALDLRDHHAVVAGPPRSGRSTALRSLAAALPGTQVVAARGGCAPLGSAVFATLERGRSGRAGVLAIDDLPELLDGPDADQVSTWLAELVRAGRELPVRLVVSGDPDALLRCYSDVVTTVRAGRTGLVLGEDAATHAHVLHATPPPRSDLPPAPGRGWLLAPGDARPVQVAVAEGPTDDRAGLSSTSATGAR
jgi:S-DNA-T family DNA segregation ATPase FtsK/SpoIIIE